MPKGKRKAPVKPKQPQKSEPIPVTVARAAEIFGVSENTVLAWCRAGLPVMARGKKGAGNATMIDLAALVPWYLADNPLDAARTRLASAQADRTEEENAVRRGELVEVAVVKRIWADMAGAVRGKFFAIPSKLSPQLVNIGNVSVIAARLTAELHAAARELVADETGRLRRGKSARGAAPGSNALPSAAAVNGESVGGSRKATQ